MSLSLDSRIAFWVDEGEDETMKGLFEPFLRKKLFTVQHHASLATVLAHLQDFSDQLSHVMVSFSLQAYDSRVIGDFMSRISRLTSDAKVLVRLPLERSSGSSAMQLIQAGAYCCLVVDQHFHMIGELLEKATEGRKPFKPFMNITWRTRLVFIATPYVKSADDHVAAIREGIRGAGLEPVESRDRITPGMWVQDQVCKDIDGCDAMVVNLTDYGKVNANVFFEAGYAHARGLKLVLVAPFGQASFPADILGMNSIEYISDVDLTQRLYYGFTEASEKWQRRAF
jgi:hypothetical protein